MAAAVCITEFTDPGCPWAYSAEPIRARLRWLYGEQIDFDARMVVLSESPQDYLDKGFTPDKMAAAFKQIARDHGMPFDTSERPRMAATRPACRAVVAARVHSDRAWFLLRALRVRHLQRPAPRRAGHDRGRGERRRSRPVRARALGRRRSGRPRAARGHGARARAAAGGARPRREARQLVRRPALHVPELRDRPPQRRRAHRGAGLPAVRGLRRGHSEPRARHAAPRAADRRARRPRLGAGPDRHQGGRGDHGRRAARRARATRPLRRTGARRSAPTGSGRRRSGRAAHSAAATSRTSRQTLSAWRSGLRVERARGDRDDAHAGGARAGDVARGVADDDRVVRRVVARTGAGDVGQLGAVLGVGAEAALALREVPADARRRGASCARSARGCP